MSKAILRAHFEQIWNSKDASGIERFIAPAYRGFETEALISGIAGYKAHFRRSPPRSRTCGSRSRSWASWRGTAARGAVLRGGDPQGPFGEIPPTGRRVRVTGEAIIRVRTARSSRSTRTRMRSGCCSSSASSPGPSRSRPFSIKVAHGVSPNRLYG